MYVCDGRATREVCTRGEGYEALAVLNDVKRRAVIFDGGAHPALTHPDVTFPTDAIPIAPHLITATSLCGFTDCFTLWIRQVGAHSLRIVLHLVAAVPAPRERTTSPLCFMALASPLRWPAAALRCRRQPHGTPAAWDDPTTACS